MRVDVKTQRIREIQQYFVLCIIAGGGSNVAIDIGDFLKFPFVSKWSPIAWGDNRGTHQTACLRV